jgi:hypothetical protein
LLSRPTPTRDMPTPTIRHDEHSWGTEHTGAGEGIRTLDPNLGKVVLYP